MISSEQKKTKKLSHDFQVGDLITTKYSYGPSVVTSIGNTLDDTAVYYNKDTVWASSKNCNHLVCDYPKQHEELAKKKKSTEKAFMKRSRPEIDKGGTKRWKNAKGQYHREDGPAMEWADGSKSYYINGQRHREDGPAIESAGGSKHYYVNGQLHREDGPAIEYADDGKSYYIDGQLHREDGPAVEYADGGKSYYIDGQLHREDGPAIEYADGSKSYYIGGKKLTEADFMKRSKPEIDKGGTKRWKNAKGQFHREDGPAIECADGGKHYYVNGQLHREDGPAMEWVDGSKFYYIGGQRHREDGPAAECMDGSKFYYIGGQLHRKNGPAIEYANGSKSYYIGGKKLTEADFMKRSKLEIDSAGTKRWKNAKGQFHREDGPAIECADGGRHYYVNGQLHREDGPAMEWVDGSKFYYIGGQRHREDGPAIECADGSKFYYIDGKKLTEDEFMKRSRPKFIAGDEVRNRITKTVGKVKSAANGIVEWIPNNPPHSSCRYSKERDMELLSIHNKQSGTKKLVEFSTEKETQLMKETIAMAHNYVTSENLKRLEKLRHNLRSRTELNRAELKAIRDGIKQPHRLASKPVIKSEAYASNVAILFLMALVGLLVGILV